MTKVVKRFHLVHSNGAFSSAEFLPFSRYCAKFITPTKISKSMMVAKNWFKFVRDDIYISTNFPLPQIRSLVGPPSQGPNNDPGIWILHQKTKSRSPPSRCCARGDGLLALWLTTISRGPIWTSSSEASWQRALLILIFTGVSLIPFQ